MSRKGKISQTLESVRSDMQVVGPVMQELVNHVIRDGISQYPVFVATVQEIGLGKPFLDRELYNLNWNYRASVLEEFVKEKVVEKEKISQFKETFGDPMERACIFLVLPEEGGFVFIPFFIEE